MNDALQLIASVANGLNKAELRILIELATRVDESTTFRTTASSRDLAERTGLARSSVQLALDELNRKKLIHTEGGTPTHSACHVLTFLAVRDEKGSGPKSSPQVAVKSGQSGLKSEPGVARSLAQGGRTTEPGVTRNSGQGSLTADPGVASNSGRSGLTVGPGVAANPVLAGLKTGPSSNGESTNPRVHQEPVWARADSIDFRFEKIIDRLHRAEQIDFEAAIFENARQQLASHHAKFARQENRQIGLPDSKITAQFLSIADWPRLESLLFDLASERKEAGHSYGWYVTVALQRIHGISPDRLRAIRTKTKTSMNSHSREDRFGSTQPQSKVSRIADRQSSVVRKSPEVERLQEQIRALAIARSL